MRDFSELFAVGALVGRFGQVKRLTEHEDGEPERDTTHTVMLALVAGQLAAEEGLDQHEVVMHALVHDLPEAYAGDTPTLRPLSPQERAEKDAREAVAVERIAAETPYLGALVRAYEARQSQAARFVWVLDKAMPKITHAWNGCAVPKRQGMDLAELRANHSNQAMLLRAKAPDVPVAHAFFAACCEHAERAFLGDWREGDDA